MWYWLSLVAAGVLVIALYYYDPPAVHRDWENALTPRGRRSLEVLADQAEMDAAMLDDAYRAAVLARLESDTAEAAYLLELALSVVQQAVPDRLTRLKVMALCCRMVSAMLPLGRVGPRCFRLTRLATMAGIVDAAEQFLLTAARFRLRLVFLSWGFRIILPAMGRSTVRIKRRPAAASSAWALFEAAVADFKRLDRAHVEAFRALLCSFVEAERPVVAR